VGATFEKYGIVRSPTDILIDPAGNVIGRPELSAAKEAISQMLVARQQWRQRFDEVYRLAEGEVLKRIAPPFIPERLEYYREMHGGRTMPRGSDQRFALILFWDGRLRLWGEGAAFSRPLGYVLNSVLRLPSYEYEGPQALLDLLVPPGDWIVRDEAPSEAKLRALEELVARELGRRIHFEKRSVEREALVATGRFQFHPLAQAAETRPDKSVHVSALDAATDPRSGAGTARSLSEFLRRLGDAIQIPVLDRTEPNESARISYSLHRSSRLQDIADEQERARRLKALLDHVTAQTELQFEIRKEPVEVWYVTEWE
jgi:hypothetical protein